MYRSFYNLKFKPFQTSSDPDFLWLGDKHREALATLRYGILDNKGFLLLTGDVGTGKTTLINTLIKSLGPDVICTSVPDPSLEKIDFFNYVARGFGTDKVFTSKGQFLVWFSYFLHTAHAGNKKVLLIIDESQLLTQELLEEIRLLSNVELAETKLLNIFFVGQSEFNEFLASPENRAVRQRLTLNYNLDSLSLTETFDYIRYRLEIAGTTERLFTDEAVRDIFFSSKGFPRRINIICDHALLTGFVKDKPLIDGDIIKECTRELDIELKKDSNISSKPDEESQETLPGPLVKPPEIKGKKGVLAFVLSAVVSLLIFAGYLMFPDRVETFLKNTSAYLKDSGVEISNRISGTNTSVPIGNGDPRKVDIEPYPIMHSPETPISKEDEVSDASVEPKENVKPLEPLENVEPKEKVKPLEPLENVKPLEPKENVNPRKNVLPMEDAKPLDSVLPVSEPITTSKAVQPQFEVVPPVLEDRVLVRFSYNTNNFTDQGLEALNHFAKGLVFYPEARVVIKGYTDSYGNEIYNRKLSEFRANIVKSYLLGKGARMEQMEAQGLGNDSPIESNDSNWGRKMNRRVEIEVISRGEPGANKN